MVMRGGCLGLAVLLVTLLSGCALDDVRLKPPSSGLKTPIPGGNQRQVIVTVPFADARKITNRCGMQKGGYGNETANAFCQGEPGRWIAEFLASELTASGFTVLPAEGGARDSALKIEGILLKIFAEPVVGVWSTTVESDLNVTLVATSRTGLRAERTFFAKGELTSVIWSQGIFNDSLEKGIRELLAKMVGAILELMTQYPELGFGYRHPVFIAWQPEPGR
jgi:hypothetical protein